MVLRELSGDAVLCITQPAHAGLSGELARVWGNGLFAEPRPRNEIAAAAAQHDLGMAEWDAEPELDPQTGWPMSFLEMPLETHLRLWSAAPRLALMQSRWTALLVSMHGAYLYSGRADRPGVQDFLDRQRQIQAELRASLEVSEADATRNQRLLVAWDWMSLALCRDDLPATVEAERAIQLRAAGPGRVTVSPWPFGVDEVAAHVDARRLDRRFEDEAAMRDALATAHWERIELRLTPG